MPDSRAAAPRGRGWTVIAGFLAAVVVLYVAGLFLPIPFLDAGSAALAGRFPWILAVAVGVAVFAIGLWVRRATVARIVIAAASLIGVAGVTALTAGQLSLATENDVALDARQLLLSADRDDAPDSWHVYGTYGDDRLELAVWLPATDAVTTDGGAPVIFMTHGGGWISGSVIEGGTPVHAKWFADRGHLVIAANYTLADEDRHLWDVQENQLGCALAWVGAHAGELGGDVSRLGAVGDSAGGNLVMQVAYKAAAGTLEPTCAGDMPAIDAVSVIYPAPDLASIYANDDPLFRPYAQEFALDYIGGTPQEYPHRYAATNPAVSVTASAPPTLAAVGEHDHLVPTDGTLAVFEAIAAAGVPVEVVIVPFGEHAFDMHPGSVGTQVWHELTLRWFADHGAR